jgi:hypothetical protein
MTLRGDPGQDPVKAVRGRLDGVRGGMERAAQHVVKVTLARIGAAVRHVSRSSTERSAVIAREVWLFTAPRVMPIVAAIWASDMSA